jgi:hypothetical protein
MALIMEAAGTSEMPVNFYQTIWCNNPEDSHLQMDTSSPIFLKDAPEAQKTRTA